MFLGMVAVLLALLLLNNPLQALLGAGVVALGLPAYAVFRRAARHAGRPAGSRPGSP